MPVKKRLIAGYLAISVVLGAALGSPTYADFADGDIAEHNNKGQVFYLDALSYVQDKLLDAKQGDVYNITLEKNKHVPSIWLNQIRYKDVTLNLIYDKNHTLSINGYQVQPVERGKLFYSIEELTILYESDKEFPSEQSEQEIQEEPDRRSNIGSNASQQNKINPGTGAYPANY